MAYRKITYSKWHKHGSNYWYTFWFTLALETRDNTCFVIADVTYFSAKQLRDDMDGCISEIISIDPLVDKIKINELRIYMKEFLQDIDNEYPLIKNNIKSIWD